MHVEEPLFLDQAAWDMTLRRRGRLEGLGERDRCPLLTSMVSLYKVFLRGDGDTDLASPITWFDLLGPWWLAP
jgi:hypothetical protein